MKKITKTMALCLASMMLLTSAAMAENTTSDAVSGATSSPSIRQEEGMRTGGKHARQGFQRVRGAGQQDQNTQTPPELPQGQSSQNTQTPPALPDGQTPPELPEGMNGQTPPAFPDGQTPPELPEGMNGQTPPALPDGQTPPELPEGMNGQTPPALPDGQNTQNDQNGQNTQNPSALPDGQNAQNGQNTQNPPVLPDGQNAQNGQGGQNGQNPPARPDGQNNGNRQAPPQGQPGMPGGMPGGDAPTSYESANTVTEDAENASYLSDQDNENAVLVSGSEVSLTGVHVSKTGSAEGDSADFYGINAAVLASDGATLDVTGAEIITNGGHANGLFSYGTGTTVNVSDTTIVTSGNNSGGLMTTGGAAMNATNVTVSTSGNSSAAIRSDRGGGTVSVYGGSYEASGVGSPAIYSTADITVENADLSASSSEAVVIEGGNSVTLRNVTISGNNEKLNGQSKVQTNVLIYQSMSGDAQEGSSVFSMEGGTMTSLTGDMFHVTNVNTEINLSGVEFTSSGDTFLSASADSWGKAGSNGGHAVLNLNAQTVSGNITVDADSSVSISLASASSLTGAVNPGSTGSASLRLDAGSTWTLTGDSYLDSLEGDLSQIDTQGYTLYVGGEAVK